MIDHKTEAYQAHSTEKPRGRARIGINIKREAIINQEGDEIVKGKGLVYIIGLGILGGIFADLLGSIIGSIFGFVLVFILERKGSNN